MPYPRAITTGHSTSLRNPCPDGTSLGTGDLNGTIILICDAAFNSLSEPINVDLALGLGLGIGIPVLCFAFWIGVRCYRENDRVTKILKGQRTIKVDNQPLLRVVDALSPVAYADFCSNTLSDTLKRELMLLRIQKGRTLIEFVREAEEKKAFEVAAWIAPLDPRTFPVQRLDLELL